MRQTRLQNKNRFKLGLFGMNCSGSIATTAPERWTASWDDNVAAARMADEAGLEFLLPIARWQGYGGATDRQGTSFETLTWASALLASTKDIVTFATIHVPLINPVFAAKSIMTADHVGHGRFGLNVVSGWNRDEFGMFGVTMREHDERYLYTEEWLNVVKRLWSESEPFNLDGAYFKLENVSGKPKPWGEGRPYIMSAGSSSVGRAFAARNADCLLMVIEDEAKLRDEVSQIRSATAGRRVEILTSGHLLCRATAKETLDYRHYLVEEHGDWEGAEAVIAKRLKGDTRSLPREKLQQMKERFISGGGTFPVIGSYDEVAHTLLRLSEAGLDGIGVTTVNYVQEMPIIRDEVLPRLERLKLRSPKA